MNFKRKCISLFVNRYDIDVERVIKIKEEINNKSIIQELYLKKTDS